MFTLHDMHWIAAVLNPRTRMLKLATDAERGYAYGLVRSEVAKIMEINRTDDDPSMQFVATTCPSSSSHKKFKSYTAQFDDDINCSSLNKNMATSTCAHREVETYLQLDLTKCTYSNEENDNPLLFWNEQQHLLPNLSKLAKKIFCIPASSATVERAFSSAGVIISHRRTSINPSTVNDMILVRSAAICSNNQI
jgi:hypothetical protein